MQKRITLRRGLTLLELLIVVLIMAAIAGAAVSLTDNLDSQTRYDDTQTRMELLRYSVAGDTRPQPDGRRLLSGFVADMGRTPNSLVELLTNAGITTTAYQLHQVVFDATPVTSNNYWNDTQDTLTTSGLAMFKGWRGPYLRSPNGATNFLDGWGNSFLWEPITGGLKVTSYGSDGPGGIATSTSSATTYINDISTTISDSDWSVPAVQVEVTYTTTLTMPINVVLSAYEVHSTGAMAGWHQYLSTPQTLNTPPTATFTINGPIPIGRHAVALFDDSVKAFTLNNKAYYKYIDVYPMVDAKVSFTLP